MLTLLAAGLIYSSLSFSQSLIFDGNFESGTFQGWIPSGENGGFASIAAKGGCFSANDTTAISFNGNLANNFAAMLRSNSAGDTNSIAKLRSLNFPAGRGILFTALSETSDVKPTIRPSQLTVRILDSEGGVLSEHPLNTSVIQLAQGCPSEKRDTAFSLHYIDTSAYSGDISIQFSQHTLEQDYAFFTLIDNVILVEKNNVFINQTQPTAIAGTSLTSSNILFLDPRSSLDSDGLPDKDGSLEYSWFINGEENLRLFDMPCVNVNSDFQLGPGNHTATLYVTDGYNYSADTIRFVVTSSQTSVDDEGDGSSDGDDTTNQNITLTTPKGKPIVSQANVVSSEGITQTDPRNECDIDVSDVLADEGEVGGNDPDSLFIDIDPSSADEFETTFTIGGDPVKITSSNVDVNSPDDAFVTEIGVSIDNPQSTDSLTEGTNTVDSLTVTINDSNSLTITPTTSGEDVSDADFELVLESILFEYTVGGGDTTETEQRSISYSISDSDGNSDSDSSLINVE